MLGSNNIELLKYYGFINFASSYKDVMDFNNKQIFLNKSKKPSKPKQLVTQKKNWFKKTQYQNPQIVTFQKNKFFNVLQMEPEYWDKNPFKATAKSFPSGFHYISTY